MDNSETDIEHRVCCVGNIAAGLIWSFERCLITRCRGKDSRHEAATGRKDGSQEPVIRCLW